MSTKEAKSFAEQYAKLNEIVKKIENIRDEDIDKISQYVKEALEIRKECENRVVMIKKSLEEQFENEE